MVFRKLSINAHLSEATSPLLVIFPSFSPIGGDLVLPLPRVPDDHAVDSCCLESSETNIGLVRGDDLSLISKHW